MPTVSPLEILIVLTLFVLPAALVARFALRRGWSAVRAVPIFLLALLVWPIALAVVLASRSIPPVPESGLDRAIPRWWVVFLIVALLVRTFLLVYVTVSASVAFDPGGHLILVWGDMRSLSWRLLVAGTLVWLVSFVAPRLGRERLTWPRALVHPISVVLMLAARFAEAALIQPG